MNITVNRETDHDITFSYLNADDTARSLVGATVYFTVKRTKFDDDADDSEALIKKDVTSHTNAAGGVTTISLTDADTNIAPGRYYYDIVVIESDSKRYQAMEGRFTIDGGVTNR